MYNLTNIHVSSSTYPPFIYFHIDGKTLEPMEEVILDCNQEYSGQVIEKLSNRKGEMVDFINMEGGGAR